jgi:hypothetical protein
MILAELAQTEGPSTVPTERVVRSPACRQAGRRWHPRRKCSGRTRSRASFVEHPDENPTGGWGTELDGVVFTGNVVRDK